VSKKIGIIGERNNPLSVLMLENVWQCEGVEVVFFVDSTLSPEHRKKMYGPEYSRGRLRELAARVRRRLRTALFGRPVDCKRFCRKRDIPFLTPERNDINEGLPRELYEKPVADYVLIAGCDQLLNENGLKLAKEKTVNYHYSPLPAYRGKFSLFWQWYNREPVLGYSFHEVDAGVDTGKIVLQGRVEYNPEKPYGVAVARVLSASARDVCNVFRLLKRKEQNIVFPHIVGSYYAANRYRSLITVREDRKKEDVQEVFRRLGYLRLENGLQVRRILEVSSRMIDGYAVDRKGISVPLSDGHMRAATFSGGPFWLEFCLIGRRTALRGLASGRKRESRR